MFINKKDKVWCRYCLVCRKPFTITDYTNVEKIYRLHFFNKYCNTETLLNEHLDMMISQSNNPNDQIIEYLLYLITNDNLKINNTLDKQFSSHELNRIMGR